MTWLAPVAFVLMEPLTYAAHRWVMHGAGWLLHRSHHQGGQAKGLEANDWFPVAFAAVTMAALAVGGGVLVPVGIGVTAYGLAYTAVHDGYIHARFFRLGPRRAPVLGYLSTAHQLHHLHGGEPYGMLCPILPKELRAATAALRHDGTRARPAKTS